MPASFVVEVETKYPGYTLAQIGLVSSRVDGRMRKRYGFPITDLTKVPTLVEAWVAAIVTPEVFLKRGISGTDEQWQEYVKRAEAADKEMLEAASAELGLFDLPAKNDGSPETGIVAVGPLVYSEQSPYVWADQQAEIGRDEDSQGEGSTR